jgi:hypothetical protein
MDWLGGGGGVAEFLGFLHELVRIVPAPIMFPVVFVLVQAAMIIDDGAERGNGIAIRAALHGSHMDLHGLAWTLGIASILTLWGIVARAMHER